MPNQCTCRLIFLGNTENMNTFSKEVDKIQFDILMSKTMSPGNTSYIVDFTYLRQPPIEEIKEMYTRLEQNNNFWIKLYLIYYETGEGFYGVYKHTTKERTEDMRYKIKEDDLYDADKNNRLCVENEDGDCDEDNWPAKQMAGDKFAKLLIKYDMDTEIASY